MHAGVAESAWPVRPGVERMIASIGRDVVEVLDVSLCRLYLDMECAGEHVF